MKQICILCKKESSRRFKRNLCPGCYAEIRNRERIDAINRDFKSPWEWNQFLWRKYVHYLSKKSSLNNCDPSLAKKFSEALCTREILPFKSWLDVFELRDELCLGYSPLKNRYGCPVSMLGRLLEADGKLPPRGKNHEFHLIFQWFPEPTKSTIKIYASGFYQKKSQSLGIKYLQHLRDFHIWLRVDLFAATEAHAKSYLQKMSAEKNTVVFRAELNSIKRFYAWSISQGLISQNPFAIALGSEFQKLCAECKKMKIISAIDTHCLLCHQSKKLLPLLEATRIQFKDKPIYNGYLFDLHLQYIKRYRITSTSYVDIRKLAEFLSEAVIEPIRLWKDVHHLAGRFNQFMQGKSRIRRGCPFIKIGHMLSELGVIPFIKQDEKTYLDNALKKFAPDIEPTLRKYASIQLKLQRQHVTVISTAHVIRYFLQWLSRHHMGTHLFLANEKMALEYLEKYSANQREHHRGILHQFYKWCQSQGISQNPFENVKPLDPARQLPICSKEQFKQLLRFIKNPDSDPSSALMLTLILFFGFAQKEILYSTFDQRDGAAEISVFQTPLSYGKRERTRRQVLQLPKQPLWFFALQKRFLEDWQRRFSRLKDPSSIRPIFLAPNSDHNRPASPFALQRLIENATVAATGTKIPMRILKMTAGHLQTYHTDASMLTELGWSSSQAFKYTWMPRRYWS